MKLQIAYRIKTDILHNEWIFMSIGFESERKIACEYALFVDGTLTFKSTLYHEVTRVSQRTRYYRGLLYSGLI